MSSGEEIQETRKEMANIEDRFEAVNDDFLKFEKVEPKLSSRSDLHAFIMLDKLFPRKSDMISHSERDEICLDVEDEEIESLSDDQILELVRCGVRYDGCLRMFT